MRDERHRLSREVFCWYRKRCGTFAIEKKKRGSRGKIRRARSLLGEHYETCLVGKKKGSLCRRKGQRT